MSRWLLLAALPGALGCEGSSSIAVDAPRGPDARSRDGSVVVGPCGDDQPFSARLLDFDSSQGSPMMIAGATFTVQSVPSQTATSAADGLVEMCVPVDPAELQRIDVDATGDYLDGVVVANPDASRIGSFDALPLRSVTVDRASAFYSAQLGVAFDATRGHVIVLNACDRNKPELDRPHATPLAAQEDMDRDVEWSSGSVGRYVLFPNVDATEPTAIVSWYPYGWPRVVPVRAGAWTMLADCFWWL